MTKKQQPPSITFTNKTIPPREELPQCKAKAKGTGKRCGNPAEPGYEVCRYHGGKTPRGIASANWKHGKRSRYPLLGQLAEMHERAVNDPEILNLTQEIALLDARSGELLGKLGTGEAGSSWRAVVEGFDTLEKAILIEDADGIREGLTTLSDAVHNGSRDFELWHGIISIVKERRELVKAEQGRRSAMQTSLNIEDMVGVIRILNGIIRRNITDKEALGRISAELQEFLYSGVSEGDQADS